MRRYEVVFVLAPDLADTDLEETINVYKVAAEEMGAKILGVEKWVRKRLAFPVKKYTEGTFVFLLIEDNQAKAVVELERRFKVTDTVIRFLTIRTDGMGKRIQKRMKLQKKDAPQSNIGGDIELESEQSSPKEPEKSLPPPSTDESSQLEKA